MDTRTPSATTLPSRTVPAECPTRTETRVVRRLAIALILLGVAVRVVRYAFNFPLWGDEVFVCQNFIGRGFLGILKQLGARSTTGNPTPGDNA